MKFFFFFLKGNFWSERIFLYQTQRKVGNSSIFFGKIQWPHSLSLTSNLLPADCLE